MIIAKDLQLMVSWLYMQWVLPGHGHIMCSHTVTPTKNYTQFQGNHGEEYSTQNVTIQSGTSHHRRHVSWASTVITSYWAVCVCFIHCLRILNSVNDCYKIKDSTRGSGFSEMWTGINTARILTYSFIYHNSCSFDTSGGSTVGTTDKTTTTSYMANGGDCGSS